MKSTKNQNSDFVLIKEMLKSTKLIGMLVLLIWFKQENKKVKIGMITLRGAWLTTEIMTRMFPTFATTIFKGIRPQKRSDRGLPRGLMCGSPRGPGEQTLRPKFSVLGVFLALPTETSFTTPHYYPKYDGIFPNLHKTLHPPTWFSNIKEGKR